MTLAEWAARYAYEGPDDNRSMLGRIHEVYEIAGEYGYDHADRRIHDDILPVLRRLCPIETEVPL